MIYQLPRSCIRELVEANTVAHIYLRCPTNTEEVVEERAWIPVHDQVGNKVEQTIQHVVFDRINRETISFKYLRR